MKKSDKETLIFAIKNHPEKTDEWLARLASCSIDTVRKYRRVYGQSRAEKLHRTKAEKALTAYREAVKAYAFMGAQPPEDHDGIEAELRDAENDLRELLNLPPC